MKIIMTANSNINSDSSDDTTTPHTMIMTINIHIVIITELLSKS